MQELFGLAKAMKFDCVQHNRSFVSSVIFSWILDFKSAVLQLVLLITVLPLKLHGHQERWCDSTSLHFLCFCF